MANQGALPSADVDVGTWTNESGGVTTLYASVDEAYASINDADYVQSVDAPSEATCQLALAAIDAPVAGPVTLWIRGLWIENVTVYFIWSAVAGATTYKFQLGNSTNVYDIYNDFVGNVLTYPYSLASGTFYYQVVPYNGATPMTGSGDYAVTITGSE
jgi:hypothetical protein